MIALLLFTAVALSADSEPLDGLTAAATPEEAEAAAVPDRSAPPVITPPIRLELQEPEVHELAPGVTVKLVTVPDVRSVEISVILHRGSHDLVGGPNEVTSALSSQLDVATLEHDADSLSIAKDLHEIRVWGWLGHHQGAVELECPKDELALGVELLGEVLLTPAFPKADLKRAQRFRKLFYEVDGPANLNAATHSAMSYAWNPADHPYGARPVVKDISKVKNKALFALHKEWLAVSPVTVLVVGDVTYGNVEPLLKAALDGIGVAGEQNPDLPIEAPTGLRVIGVEAPGEKQAKISLRTAAPIRLASDRVAAEMTNWALGGHFLSRLNRNLREDKGFTYGSRSRYFTDDTRGSITISVDVKAKNVEATITEIQGELDALVAEGVTEDELGASALEDISWWNEALESASTAGSFYGSLVDDGESVADVRARGDAALEVSNEDTVQVAKTWLAKDQTRVWVIGGDRDTIGPQLAALGFEVEWVSAEDAILGTF